MTSPKVSLNLNEENELAFRISIEGSSTDIESTKPKFRFVVTEQGKGTGMFYPANESEDGYVTARLVDQGLYSEEKKYQGKLEVFLGNHYFVPAEVDIEFIRPLKVEGAVVTNKSSATNSLREEKETIEKEKPLAVSAVEIRNSSKSKSPVRNESVKLKSAEAKFNKREKRQNSTPSPSAARTTARKRNWNDLTKEEQKRVVALLKERKRKELLRKKAAKQKKEKIEEMKLKKQLKELMGTSLKDK